MQEILNDSYTIIPNIIKNIKDMISYFWQPNMSKDYTSPNRSQIKYQKPKKEINKTRNLTLDNIMVLQIGQNNSYVITMMGLRQINCDERILLNNGQKEITLIEKCLEENIELERKSILNYMSSEYIEIYNEALKRGNYECCLTMLRSLELHLNQMSEERNILLLKRKGEQ